MVCDWNHLRLAGDSFASTNLTMYCFVYLAHKIIVDEGRSTEKTRIVGVESVDWSREFRPLCMFDALVQQS